MPTLTTPTPVTWSDRWLSSLRMRGFSVFIDGPGTDPSYVLESRRTLAPVFDDLNRYERTMHFNGRAPSLWTGTGTMPRETPLHHRAPRLLGRRCPDDDGRLAALSGRSPSSTGIGTLRNAKSSSNGARRDLFVYRRLADQLAPESDSARAW